MTVQEAKEVLNNIWNFADAQDEEKGDVVDDAIIEAIGCMEEVEQYRALGTVEELKEAREKQVAKKPRTDDEDWLCCRNCGETFSLVNTLHKRNKYCGNCGTKIDWSKVGGINGNR